mmetsp:Transcript_30443/g.44453  ORF Transcript_30443/g.44453 Transcript_30443/m.44453 type:complete len:214 (-) Transcript_30443:418-1059(-)
MVSPFDEALSGGSGGRPLLDGNGQGGSKRNQKRGLSSKFLPRFTSKSSVTTPEPTSMSQSYKPPLEPRAKVIEHYDLENAQGQQQLLDEMDQDDEENLIQDELQQRGDDLTEALLRERHEEVQNIHSSLALVNEIQRDLAGMVESQQEQVDLVEENAEETAERADRGLGHIERASQRDKQTRSMLFGIGIIVIIALIAVFIYFLVKHSKNKNP